MSEHIPSLTFDQWPTTPILARYRLVVHGSCTCSISVQKLVYCSCVCHGLEVYLCILLLILDLLWRELFSDSPFFISLLLSRAEPCLIVGFPSFSSFFAPSVILLPFWSYHFAVPAMVLFDQCLLGLFWACCMFISQLVTMTQYSHWIYTSCYFGLSWPITLLVGSFGPFLPPWASLAHSLSLGILGPFSNSAFTWVFTNSFRLP